MAGNIGAFVLQIMDTHGDAVLAVIAQHVANQVSPTQILNLNSRHMCASASEVVCLGVFALSSNFLSQSVLHQPCNAVLRCIFMQAAARE